MFSDGLKKWIKSWVRDSYTDKGRIDHDIELFEKALSLTPQLDEVAGIPRLREHLEKMSNTAFMDDLVTYLDGLNNVEPFLKHLYSVLFPGQFENKRRQRDEEGLMTALSPLLRDEYIGTVPNNYSLSEHYYKRGNEDRAFNERKRAHYDFVYDKRNGFSHDLTELSQRDVFDIISHFLFVYLDISNRNEDGIKRAYSKEIIAGNLRLKDYCGMIEGEYRRHNEEGFRYVDVKWSCDQNGGTQYSTVSTMLEDRKHRRVKILGEAGTGKTTVMAQLEYLAARRCAKDPSFPMPVFISLGSIVFDPMVPKALHYAICERLGIEQGILDEVLMTRQLMLLLDGFNEILDESWQRRLSREIEDFARNYPKCTVYVSDRSVIRPIYMVLKDAVEYKLYPMDETVKRTFIANYCRDDSAREILYDNMNGVIIRNIGTPLRLIQLIDYVSAEGRMPDNFTKEYIEFVFRRELYEKMDPDARNLDLYCAALARKIANTRDNVISRHEASACLRSCIDVFGGDPGKVDKYLDLLIDLGILSKGENNSIRFKLEEYLFCFLEMSYYKENRDSKSIDELLTEAEEKKHD